jgi:hypothetical protein
MSKQITFFRDRLQTSGHTYKFEVDDGARILRFSVFSQKPLEEKLIKTRPLGKENKGDLQPEVNKIKSAIQQGEGGVIAIVYEENRNRYLWTIPVSPQSESAFGSVGILRPGHPSLDLEPLQPTKGVVPLPAGSHALIPVDLEAEKRLRGFQDHLGYLPADLESLVLHTLRHPSLEARVGLLEEMVRKNTVEPPSGKSWTHRIFPSLAESSSSGRSVSLWRVIAALLGLVLVFNTVVLYLILKTDNGSITVSPILPVNSTPAAAATPNQIIFALIQAVRGKSANQGMVALAQGHFAKVQKEGDLDSLLAPGDDGKLLVRGLMKLEAFRLNQSEGEKLFGNAENWTDLNNFYQGRELEAQSRNMLAALACAAFQSPGLEKTKKTGAVSFAESEKDCNSYPLDKALPGLDELLKRLQKIQ